MDWKKAVLRGKDIKDTLKELESQIDMLQDDKEQLLSQGQWLIKI